MGPKHDAAIAFWNILPWYRTTKEAFQGLAKEGRKKENPISSIYNTCINSIVSLALHAFFREAVTPDIETKEKTWAKIQICLACL